MQSFTMIDLAEDPTGKHAANAARSHQKTLPNPAKNWGVYAEMFDNVA